MNNRQVHRIKTISEFHRFRGLPKPEHPLISVIDLETIEHFSDLYEPAFVYRVATAWMGSCVMDSLVN